MYPLDVLNLFPPFPRNDNVFVAMSFDKKSDNRWNNVIEPAIREVGLEPYRVDKKTISDSIITEIVSGISNCSLFFADLSYFDKLNDRPLRNENVLYEVGIAHSRRLAEEVILFRSDNEKLMFDLANIRVNHYSPDEDPENAKRLVIEALQSAIDEIKLQKHFSVQQAVDSLTQDCCMCLLSSRSTHWNINDPIYNQGITLFNIVKYNSILQLIELGILTAQYPNLGSNLSTKNSEQQDKKSQHDGENMSYKITSFGKAVIAEVMDRLNK